MNIELICRHMNITSNGYSGVLVYLEGVDKEMLLEEVTELPYSDVLDRYDLCTLKEYIRRKEDD